MMLLRSKGSGDGDGDVGPTKTTNETRENHQEEVVLTDEEDYRLTIKNYISLLETPKLESNNFDPEEFELRYSTLYEKSVTVTANYGNGEVKEQNFEELKDDIDSWLNQPGLAFKIFRYKMVSPGCLDFIIRGSTSEFDLKISGLAHYKNGKIYRADVTRTIDRKVSGQISVRKEENGGFGLRVYELPSTVNHQVLGMKASMLPVEEKYVMLLINLAYKKKNGINQLLFWQDDFEIHLTCSDGKAYAGGAKFVCAKRPLKPTEFVLLDHKNKPVALCEERARQVTIYGTWSLEPMADVGEDSTDKQNPSWRHVGEQIFYPWFSLKRETILGNHLYFVFVLSKVNLESEFALDPVYKIEICKDGPKNVYKITDHCTDHGQYGMVTSESKDNGLLQVSVAPGVDPALILCLAVCVGNQESAWS